MSSFLGGLEFSILAQACIQAVGRGFSSDGDCDCKVPEQELVSVHQGHQCFCKDLNNLYSGSPTYLLLQLC